MPFQGKSLLDLKSLTKFDVDLLFQKAEHLKETDFKFCRGQSPKLVALVFLEPSTRTSASFEVAALRLGHKVFKVFGDSSSVKKGETLQDTLLTLNAMGPDLIVVRHGTTENLSNVVPQLTRPLINAGEGVSGHPTQALLDAFTIQKSLGRVDGQRILFVGDIAHSRVVSSNVELLQTLGAEVMGCGPLEWKTSMPWTDSLEAGLKWATVCMPLRVQKERHQKTIDLGTYAHDFQLNSRSLHHFSKNGIIMHPGPFNRGVELDEEVLVDSRCVIWDQVENGVFIRAALMSLVLGEEK